MNKTSATKEQAEAIIREVSLFSDLHHLRLIPMDSPSLMVQAYNQVNVAGMYKPEAPGALKEERPKIKISAVTCMMDFAGTLDDAKGCAELIRAAIKNHHLYTAENAAVPCRLIVGIGLAMYLNNRGRFVFYVAVERDLTVRARAG